MNSGRGPSSADSASPGPVSVDKGGAFTAKCTPPNPQRTNANVQEILRRLSALAAAGRLRNVSDVIVIDGGSTDGTQELVREAGSAVGAFRLTLVEHPSNLGPVEAQLSVPSSGQVRFRDLYGC